MFSIRLVGDPFLLYGEWTCRGVLHANGFEEQFDSPLSCWNQQDYVEQWCGALRHLMEHDQTAVALVTSMRHPDTQNFVFRWLLSREGNNVFLQQHMLFTHEVGERLSSRDALAHIPRRRTVNEEGQSISEWPVTLEGVKDFLGQCQGKGLS